MLGNQTLFKDASVRCRHTSASLLVATRPFLGKPRPSLLCPYPPYAPIYPTPRVAPSVPTTCHCFAKGILTRKAHAVPGREVLDIAGWGERLSLSCASPRRIFPLILPQLPLRTRACLGHCYCLWSFSWVTDDHSLLRSLLYPFRISSVSSCYDMQ